MHIFSYVTTDASKIIRSFAVIWKGISTNSIESVRVGFADGTSVDEALAILGYSKAFFSTQETNDTWLGDIPYHSIQFTAEDAAIEHTSYGGTYKHDAKFIFLLNHFDDTVELLSVQH